MKILRVIAQILPVLMILLGLLVWLLLLIAMNASGEEGWTAAVMAGAIAMLSIVPQLLIAIVITAHMLVTHRRLYARLPWPLNIVLVNAGLLITGAAFVLLFGGVMLSA